jgi:hypothetical protein
MRIVRLAVVLSVSMVVVGGAAIGGAFLYGWYSAGNSVEVAPVGAPSLKVAKKNEPIHLPEKPMRRLHLALSGPSVSGLGLLGSDGSLLLRELARQSLLLAARDELGLATQDEALGDLLTLDDPFRMEVSTLSESMRIQCSVSFGQGVKSNWSDGFEVSAAQKSPMIPEYRSLLEQLEKMTRAELAAKLREARFEREVARSVDPPSLEGVDEEIDKLAVLSQLSAIQKIHAQESGVRDEPINLGRLTRAYANLGMLTHSFWLSMSPTFTARGMLYAQRLIGKDPKSPTGYWHRAYAFGMAGLDQLALDDIAEGQKLGAGSEPPAWIRLLEAQCRYDFDGVRSWMRTLSVDTEVARFLLWRSLGGEMSASREALEVAEKFVTEKHALCVPITRSATSGYLMGLTRQTFLQEEKELRQEASALGQSLGVRLPAADVGGESRDVLASIPQRLVKVSGTEDEAEPSFQTAGRLIQDSMLQALANRLDFMEETWNVPTQSEWKRLWPTVKGHPYSGLLEATRRNDLGGASGKDVWAGSNVKDVRTPMFRVLMKLGEMRDGEVLRNEVFNQMIFHLDTTGADFAAFAKLGASPLISMQMPRWLAVSPFRPFANTSVFATSVPTADEEVASFVRRFGRHPESAAYIAKILLDSGREELAEESLKLTNQSVGSKWSFFALARIYQSRGDKEGWKRTLDEFIAQPVQTLDHAEARKIVADQLMSEGKFEEAWPYAEGAGKSFASWGMFCAAECAEGRGDFETAGQLMEMCANVIPINHLAGTFGVCGRGREIWRRH